MLISALLLALTLLLSWATYGSVRRAATAAARERLISVVEQVAGLLQTSATHLVTAAQRPAADPAIKAFLRHRDAGSRAKALLVLRSRGPESSAPVDMELRTLGGERLLTGLARPLQGVEGHEPGLVRLASGTDSGAVGGFRAVGDSVLYPAVAPVMERGRVVGYLVQWWRLRSSPRAREQTNALIGAGAVLYFGNTAGDVWTDQVRAVSRPPVDNLGTPGVLQYERPGTGRVLAAVRQAKGTPWSALVEFPNEVVDAPARTFLRQLLLISLVLVALGLVSAWVLSGRVTEPLHRLMSAAEAVAAGDYSHHVRVEGRDEVGRLADVFNVVAGQAQHGEYARQIVDATYSAFVAIDEDGVITGWNRKAETTFGWSREEAIGQPLAELIIPQQFRVAHRRGLKHFLATGEGPVLNRVIELTALRRSGAEFPVQLTISALRISGRHVFTAFLLDITERKEAEATLKRFAAELEAANAELDAFAYSVSHDLRAPLRSIDGFSQVLLEDYAAQLDESGRDALRRVRAATQRMGTLIDDLLKLSRFTRIELRTEVVDLSAIAQSIAGELKHTAADRQVEWTIQPGLAAQGDPRLLRVVLENLLGNSWKYTAKQPLPRIEFNATEQNGDRVFMVRDNGAGFDMRYADKLFGVFQRLHSRTEFEGSGVGLATVQRIISRHGGRIWAEGAVGRGATFYFTLPRPDARTAESS